MTFSQAVLPGGQEGMKGREGNSAAGCARNKATDCNLEQKM